MTNYSVEELRKQDGQAYSEQEPATQHTDDGLVHEERRLTNERRLFTLKLTELVWLFFGVVEGLIGLRVLLRLLAANPNNPFAAFIYRITELFVLPFQGLTAQPSAEGFVLEIPSIIAMLVYALLAWAIAKFIWVLLYKPREPV